MAHEVQCGQAGRILEVEQGDRNVVMTNSIQNVNQPVAAAQRTRVRTIPAAQGLGGSGNREGIPEGKQEGRALNRRLGIRANGLNFVCQHGGVNRITGNIQTVAVTNEGPVQVDRYGIRNGSITSAAG